MTHPKGKLVHEMAAAIRDKSLSKALPFDHKKGPILCTERLTCALPDGLPSFFNRGQSYKKIPKPARDFGNYFHFILNFSMISINSSSRITLILHPWLLKSSIFFILEGPAPLPAMTIFVCLESEVLMSAP